MTKASTPHSSLSVELSSRTSGVPSHQRGERRHGLHPAAGSLDELVVGHAWRGRRLQGRDDG